MPRFCAWRASSLPRAFLFPDKGPNSQLGESTGRVSVLRVGFRDQGRLEHRSGSFSRSRVPRSFGSDLSGAQPSVCEGGASVTRNSEKVLAESRFFVSGFGTRATRLVPSCPSRRRASARPIPQTTSTRYTLRVEIAVTYRKQSASEFLLDSKSVFSPSLCLRQFSRFYPGEPLERFALGP